MGSGDLDISLLYKIMMRAGEFRGRKSEYAELNELLDLLPPCKNAEETREARLYLHRHLVHLREREFIYYTRPVAPEVGCDLFRMRIKGELFVQPELAEFGKRSLLPQVVKSIEEQVEVLTYPEEEKKGMLFKLREAIAKQAPDVIAKVLVDVGSKILTGGV